MTPQEKVQQAIIGLKYMKHRVHENSAAYYWYDIAIRSLEAWDKVLEELASQYDPKEPGKDLVVDMLNDTWGKAYDIVQKHLKEVTDDENE